jgi:hypothetical protein
MDYLLIFFIFIIACVIGISIGLLLDMKSYLKIAIIILLLFIPMELYNELISSKMKKTPVPNSQPNTISNPNGNSNINLDTKPNITLSTTDYYPAKDDANSKYAKQKDLVDTKYAIFKKKNITTGIEKDELPLDGLDPQTLVSKLDYIYYATANPYKPITYTDFKTHADKYLDADGTKLSALNIDPKLLGLSRAHYPQLTSDQIDARDCLNYGSDSANSCFQSPQLFYNINNGSNGSNGNTILSNGVNQDNANLIIKEDFTNSTPMILNNASRYNSVLFKNAPKGNLDKILDSQSNEYINLDESGNMCRTCKVAVCKDDVCSLQNSLFM